MAKFSKKKGWRRSRFFNFFKGIIKIFKRKPTIINLNEKPISELCIYASNHSAASGPLTIELYLGKFFVPWGVYNMSGNYRMRWKYLYYVFYQEKLGYGKFKSFVIATLFALISKMLYRATELIPTYTDMRLKTTLDTSLKKLEQGKSILIFPEASEDGYHIPVRKYYPGFVALSRLHTKKTGKEIPVYLMCYSKKENVIVICPPVSIQSFVDKGMNNYQIAEHIKNMTNDYYKKYIIDAPKDKKGKVLPIIEKKEG